MESASTRVIVIPGIYVSIPLLPGIFNGFVGFGADYQGVVL